MARKKSFPTIPVLVLVLGIIWLIQFYYPIDIPLIPIFLIVFSIGWIVSFYSRK